MEFKGTKEKWSKCFVNENKRAIRSSGGILMTFWKPSKYSGQDERYESELNETKANQLLCLKAPEMLEELNDTIDDLKILKSNILDASKTNNRWEGMPDVIQNWIDRKEELIKSATSFKV